LIGTRRPRLAAGALSALVVLLLAPSAGADEPTAQFWGNATLTWIVSRQLTMGVDIEPKALLSKPSDTPGWATLEATPSIEYTRGNWFDVVGELVTARTRQTDDLDTTEITPRLGFRFHILSNVANDLFKEKRPKHRLVIRDYLRFEWRHLYYSTDKPDSSTFRTRNRLELEYPLNRARVSDDGAFYLTGDVEVFRTVEELDERFASRERVRGGIGHRRSRAWRFEGLYVWDRSRKTATDGFTTADHAINLRVKRVW
jgi:hypothetical protein